MLVWVKNLYYHFDKINMETFNKLYKSEIVNLKILLLNSSNIFRMRFHFIYALEIYYK